MKQFEIEVVNALRELEIPVHFRGYECIKTAMNYLHEHPQSIYSITKELYPEVGKLLGLKGSQVERNIRNALENAYSDFLTQQKVLKTSRELTNSEFLATLNEVIKVKLATDENLVVLAGADGEKITIEKAVKA